MNARHRKTEGISPTRSSESWPAPCDGSLSGEDFQRQGIEVGLAARAQEQAKAEPDKLPEDSPGRPFWEVMADAFTVESRTRGSGFRSEVLRTHEESPYGKTVNDYAYILLRLKRRSGISGNCPSMGLNLADSGQTRAGAE